MHLPIVRKRISTIQNRESPGPSTEMRWLITIGSGGCRRGWSLWGMSANFILKQSKICVKYRSQLMNSLSWGSCAKEKEWVSDDGTVMEEKGSWKSLRAMRLTQTRAILSLSWIANNLHQLTDNQQVSRARHLTHVLLPADRIAINISDANDVLYISSPTEPAICDLWCSSKERK